MLKLISMPTKYILHGGCAQKSHHNNTQFFKEIVKNTAKHLKVLLIYFASDTENDKQNLELDSGQFITANTDKSFNFTIAKEESFMNEIKSANIIYIGGGYTAKIIPIIKKFIINDLKDAFQNKIIVGESAGANALSKYGYSTYTKVIYEGLGVLPIFTIPHYKKGDEKLISNIPLEVEKNYLAEYEYKVYHTQ